MKMRLTLLLTAVLVLGTLISCGGGSDTIKIGVAGPHTGDLASYGIPTIKAAELVVKDWNENGGLLGKQIELVIEDDVCDPKIAPDVATKMIGEDVAGVIGHICSGATEAALGIYFESEIPVISPSATNPPLTQSGSYPNFFRTIAPDDAQARLEVDFAKSLGVTQIAVLHDKQSYGKGLAEFARSFIEEDGSMEVVLFEGIQAGAVDYSAVLNKVENSGAEAIIYGGYHPEASKLVTQMNEKGMNQVFISDDGVKDETFIEIAGENAEGVYASGPNDTTNDPVAIKAKEDHVADYGEDPGAFFYNAYAATQALLEAIQTADSTDYEAVTEALRSQYVDTTLGSISFDEKGDAIGVGFTMFQVQNGRYVAVE
ncbi:branched-chain amino acid ABC transporter substrate-binding protein [Salinispira pacifica]|uniref:Branched-chain amino acid ABC transporter, amino acid-binding protein n=1 Tax=Salinispira pacifica TaxID=1307761 RepID=V5WKZ3_9SPIO|nr:branched-chain amino acid ABC transporter substrate-binding protein [Salinispira pacifica]AHC16418.1 Branched-chain amino acid ABC transporter, amino acid-binding protein [Salinispira pacifica]